METQDKQRLERVLELSEENNKILKKILRTMRWARLVRIIYWSVIIAASVGAFYYIQPYWDGLRDLYGGAQDTVQKINSSFGR